MFVLETNVSESLNRVKLGLNAKLTSGHGGGIDWQSVNDRCASGTNHIRVFNAPALTSCQRDCTYVGLFWYTALIETSK